jgi:hypothetical protein
MHNIKLLQVHSLSLRKKLSIEYVKQVCSNSYCCSFCNKTYVVGVSNGVYFDLTYSLMGVEKTVVGCSHCVDLLVDCLMWGQSPLFLGKKWLIRSKFNRASILDRVSYCAFCSTKNSTYLVLRYDRLQSSVKNAKNIYSCFCARCVVAYVELMLAKKALTKIRRDYVKTDEGVIYGKKQTIRVDSSRFVVSSAI